MNSPKTDAELATTLRGLVIDLLSYDSPSSWPLSDEERIWFVRRFVGEAKRIHDSKPFLRAQLGATLEAYQQIK